MISFLTTLFCPNPRTGQPLGDFAVFSLTQAQAFQLDRLHEETGVFLKMCAETDLLSGAPAAPIFKTDLVQFRAFKYSQRAKDALRGFQFITSMEKNAFGFWGREGEIPVERYCLEIGPEEIRFSAALSLHPGNALLPPIPLRSIQAVSFLGAPPMPIPA